MRFIKVHKVLFQLIAFIASESVFLNLVSCPPAKILAFTTLLLVPGTFLSYLIKIPKLVLWPSRVAFSLIMLMLIGLLLNTVLPFIHILTPLKVVYLLPSITVATMILAWFARNRNNGYKQFDYSKITAKLVIVIILYVLMLVATVLGVIRLNNGSGNQLTMIAIGGLAILNFAVLFALKKSERYIFPFILYVTGLAILLMFSLRSAYAVGWDIQAELHVFNLTAINSRWLISNDNNVYNATLSLTILPTIFKDLLHVSSDMIFKLFYPILTATLGPIIYAIARKFGSKRQSFLAALFFIVQGEFMQQLPALARQEIAYIFFALLLYYILDKSLTNRKKNVFIIILGAAMIVGHYSTAYTALIALLIAVVFYRIITFYLKNTKKQEKNFINVRILLVLLLVTFLWCGQISNGSNGIVTTVKTSFKNLMLSNTQEQKSISAQEALFGTAKSNSELVSMYSNNLSSNISSSVIKNSIYPISTQEVSTNNAFITSFSSIYDFIAQKSIKIFLVFGVSLCIYQIYRREKLNKERIVLYSIALSFSILLLAITLLPSFSLFYNFERLYQQSLIVLGIIIILGGTVLIKYIFRKFNYVYIVIGFLFMGYFLGYTGFLTQIAGGNPTMQLSNYGIAYDEYYKHEGEVLAGQWLVNTKKTNQFIATDVLGQTKLDLFYNSNSRIYSNLILHALDKNTYIYETYTNVNTGIELEQYDNQVITLSYPSTLINNNKSLIYNNGVSSIYL